MICCPFVVDTAEGHENHSTAQSTNGDEPDLAPYPDKPYYVTYSIDEGLSFDEGEENNLSSRLQSAVEKEQVRTCVFYNA